MTSHTFRKFKRKVDETLDFFLDNVLDGITQVSKIHGNKLTPPEMPMHHYQINPQAQQVHYQQQMQNLLAMQQQQQQQQRVQPTNTGHSIVLDANNQNFSDGVSVRKLRGQPPASSCSGSVKVTTISVPNTGSTLHRSSTEEAIQVLMSSDEGKSELYSQYKEARMAGQSTQHLDELRGHNYSEIGDEKIKQEMNEEDTQSDSQSLIS